MHKIRSAVRPNHKLELSMNYIKLSILEKKFGKRTFFIFDAEVKLACEIQGFT